MPKWRELLAKVHGVTYQKTEVLGQPHSWNGFPQSSPCRSRQTVSCHQNNPPPSGSVFIAPQPFLARRCSRHPNLCPVTVYSVQCTADEEQSTCISRDPGASPHTVKSNRYGGVSPYTNTWPYFALGHKLNSQVLSLTDENRSDLDSVGSHFISGLTLQRNPHRCIYRYSQFANCLVLSL